MKKIFSILALALVAMTASAIEVPTYELKPATEAVEHGTIKFYRGTDLNNPVTRADEGDKVTMTITPKDYWVVNTDKVAGLWIASEARAPRRVDMVKDIALTYVSTDATTNAVTYTFTMIRANAEISCAYKKLLTSPDISVDVAEATYTGSTLKPEVTVKDGDYTLVKGTDYTVSYSNNTNAALSTATTNAPTVTITAVSTSEKYTGTTTKTFTIDKAAGSISYAKSTATVTYGNTTYYTHALTKAPATGTGLGTITYSSSNTSVATVNTSGGVTIRGAGTATITATVTDGDNYTYSGMNGYNNTTHQASVSYTLTVKPATMELVATGYGGVYDGKSHDITVAVSKPITGYTIKYGTTSGNYNLSSCPTRTDAGNTNVYYQVTAPNYTTTTGGVNITINKAALSVTADDKSVTYGDAAPEYTVTYDGFVNNETASVLGGTLNMACEYAAGSNVGTYSITPSGLTSNNYNVTYNPGTLTVDAKEIDYENGDVTLDENGYTVNMTEDANNPSADPLPDDADLSNLTYGRELTAPGNEPGGDGSGDIVIDEKPANMYTVCLPFAPKKDAALKYYTLTGVSGATLHFDEVADAQSHTPYLVAVFGDVNVTEDCSNLDVTSMTINSKTVDGYTFNGTFTGKKNADALGLYILQRKMQWGKVTSGSVYLPPFRAFIEAPATSASQLTGIIGDGNATGIENIRTVDLDGTERWYDLSGRRIATPAKGIYINNGRKVVVK